MCTWLLWSLSFVEILFSQGIETFEDMALSKPPYTNSTHTESISTDQNSRDSLSSRSKASPLGTVTRKAEQAGNTALSTKDGGKSNNCFITQPPALRARPNTDPFSFYIPYNTSQACNIYGALCQTDLITVAVSKADCRTSITTMPCSSYLQQQKDYLNAFAEANDELDKLNAEQVAFVNGSHVYNTEWQNAFGRRSECHSYGSVFDKGWSETAIYTFSQCSQNMSKLTVTQTTALPTQVPKGVFRSGESDNKNPLVANINQCCGACRLKGAKVELFYFPDPEADAYCRERGREVRFFQIGAYHSFALAEQS